MISLHQLLVNESIKKFETVKDKLAYALTTTKLDGTDWYGYPIPLDPDAYTKITIRKVKPTDMTKVYFFITEQFIRMYIPQRHDLWALYEFVPGGLKHRITQSGNKLKTWARELPVIFEANLTEEPNLNHGWTGEVLSMDDHERRMWLNKVKNTVIKPLNNTEDEWNELIDSFNNIWSGTDLVYMRLFGVVQRRIWRIMDNKRATELLPDVFKREYGTTFIDDLKMDHIQKLLKKKQDELDPMVFKCFMNFVKLMEELH